MTRRKLLSLLAALPLVGRFAPKPRCPLDLYGQFQIPVRHIVAKLAIDIGPPPPGTVGIVPNRHYLVSAVEIFEDDPNGLRPIQDVWKEMENADA